jgi:uncharacterized protein (TIGR02996 family)
VTEPELFTQVAREPADHELRRVYADWLEQAGDPRADFVRLHLALAPLPPDFPDRIGREAELSKLRAAIADDAWLAVIEPERVRDGGRRCGCFTTDELDQWREVELHREPQDTECDAWKRLCDRVEEAARDGRATFSPLRDLEDSDQIVTLPPTIGTLVECTTLELYGSSLVRIPPELGQMASLRTFEPYTSYRLHWLPYEVRRCTRLRSSTVSTRALYGNYKYRPPFPRVPERYPEVERACCVCAAPFLDRGVHRAWISLGVGADVWPLLVNACSAACTERIPAPPDGYLAGLHHGGPVPQNPDD